MPYTSPTPLTWHGPAPFLRGCFAFVMNGIAIRASFSLAAAPVSDMPPLEFLAMLLLSEESVNFICHVTIGIQRLSGMSLTAVTGNDAGIANDVVNAC